MMEPEGTEFCFERGEMGMTTNMLKLIAIVSMFIDHLHGTVLDQANLMALGMDMSGSAALGQGMYLVGRLAFPLFAFLIGEGCRHTHNAPRYVGRLLTFALIAEVPYNWAFYQSFPLFATNNVLFTLALGAVCCLLFTRIWEEHKTPRTLVLALIAVFLLGMAAEAWGTEGGALGVWMVFVPYALGKKPLQLASMAVLLWIFYVGSMWLHGSFGWSNMETWLASLASLVCIGFYNGQRGKKRGKWFFYWFYPGHLAFLAGANALLTPLLAAL